MNLLRPFFVLVLLLLPGLAQAHGPTRQKLTLAVDVAAAPADVWAVIGNFHDMSWQPAVFSTTGEGGNDIDSIRVLTLGQEGGDFQRNPKRVRRQQRRQRIRRLRECPSLRRLLRRLARAPECRCLDDVRRQ